MSAPVEARPPLSPRTVFVRYVAFAVTAGACNLVMQEVWIRLVGASPVMLSVLFGTAVGFAVKYLLDRNWIFMDGYAGQSEEARKVAVYGLVSVFTTLLFWAVELAFLFASGSAAAKYLGAVIGLAIGNVVKYRLDKQYVFDQPLPLGDPIATPVGHASSDARPQASRPSRRAAA